MIEIRIGEKNYSVPFISGRALRSIEPMEEIYRKASENEALNGEDMDRAAAWFCLLFRDQFTVNDLYDGYPADRLWADIFTAYLAVRGGVADKLEEFPMMPEATPQAD